MMNQYTKVTENDIWEYWIKSGPAVGPDGTKLVCHERKIMDARARLLIEFVKMGAHSLGFADLMAGVHEHEHQPHQSHKEYKPNVEALVIRAAEMVEQIYFEAERRNWMLSIPPYDIVKGIE